MLKTGARKILVIAGNLSPKAQLGILQGWKKEGKSQHCSSFHQSLN